MIFLNSNFSLGDTITHLNAKMDKIKSMQFKIKSTC